MAATMTVRMSRRRDKQRVSHLIFCFSSSAVVVNRILSILDSFYCFGVIGRGSSELPVYWKRVQLHFIEKSIYILYTNGSMH